MSRTAGSGKAVHAQVTRCLVVLPNGWRLSCKPKSQTAQIDGFLSLHTEWAVSRSSAGAGLATPSACYTAPLIHVPTRILPIEDDVGLATLTVQRSRAGRGLRATTAFPEPPQLLVIPSPHVFAGSLVCRLKGELPSLPGKPQHLAELTTAPTPQPKLATKPPLFWQGLYNGWRLSGIRADHVLASIGWPGANDHSKRVLYGATAAAESSEKRLTLPR